LLLANAELQAQCLEQVAQLPALVKLRCDVALRPTAGSVAGAYGALARVWRELRRAIAQTGACA